MHTMALSSPLPRQTTPPIVTFPKNPCLPPRRGSSNSRNNSSPFPNIDNTSHRRPLSIPPATLRRVRFRSLDSYIKRQKQISFPERLKRLILSTPKHYLPLSLLSSYSSHLTFPVPKCLPSLILTFPTIFQFFILLTPQNKHLCLRLTPQAEALSTQELALQSSIASTLADKIQKLLMLSHSHTLILSKLTRLAPDLGLPPNFESRLLYHYPKRFKIAQSRSGPFLKLVSWSPRLAIPLPWPRIEHSGTVTGRPFEFRHLRLRNGLLVRRSYHGFLQRFCDEPDICPYQSGRFEHMSFGEEKRACAVVREVLGMTVEKRTLVDHIDLFRKEFWLPKNTRKMILRHPDLFYVSMKGTRDHVFLVDAFDDRGGVVGGDWSSFFKNRLFRMVAEGKELVRRRVKMGLDVGMGELPCVREADIVGEPGVVDGFEGLFEDEQEDGGGGDGRGCCGDFGLDSGQGFGDGESRLVVEGPGKVITRLI